MFFGIGLFICLLLFTTPSGKFQPSTIDVDSKRREAKNNGWVLNEPAYRDGVEMYTYDDASNIRFWNHKPYRGVRV